jgi:ketosteroid isomerase-like protein
MPDRELAPAIAPRVSLERLARTALAAITEGDDATLGAFLNDETVIDLAYPSPGLPVRLNGRAAIQANVAALRTRLGALRLTLRDLHVSMRSDTACVLIDVAGVGAEARPIGLILTVGGGRIACGRLFFDTLHPLPTQA